LKIDMQWEKDEKQPPTLSITEGLKGSEREKGREGKEMEKMNDEW
jgi:hypothetical protein